MLVIDDGSTDATAAVAAGCDGLIVEVHPDPANARSDGDQSLSFDEFGALMDELRRLQFVRATDATRAPAPATPIGGEGIEEVRDRIDELDTRLVEMVQERAALALERQRLTRSERNLLRTRLALSLYDGRGYASFSENRETFASLPESERAKILGRKTSTGAK